MYMSEVKTFQRRENKNTKPCGGNKLVMSWLKGITEVERRGRKER